MLQIEKLEGVGETKGVSSRKRSLGRKDFANQK